MRTPATVNSMFSASAKLTRNVFDSLSGQIELRQRQADTEEATKLDSERRKKEDRAPISPREWITNPYFSGSIAESLYPKLRDAFCRIYEEQYHEIVLGGATRYGKTTLALALNGYACYLISCMGMPQKNFRLMEQSPILMMNMNVTIPKARLAYFTKFSSWIRSTPYFKQEFPPQSNVTRELRFPKNLRCRFAGAAVGAAESEDLLFFVGDEVNLYDVVENSKRAIDGIKYDAAELIESAISRRMNGTYMRADGSFPDCCKMIWLCKETYPNSFIRKRIKEMRRLGFERPGHCYILESSEWGVKPEGTYEPKYFWIRTASRMMSARIIDDPVEAKAEETEALRRETDPATPEDEIFKIFRVPEAHRKASRHLEVFIRDMCGYPTEAISLYLKDRQLLDKAIRVHGHRFNEKPVPLALCEHPFNETVSDLSRITFNMNFCERKFIDGFPVSRPIMNPHTVRYIHIDAGLTTDPMGIAMGHQAGWKRVIRYDHQGQPADDTAPFIWIDFMLRVVPEVETGQINFAHVRRLVHSLSGAGFLIGKITMDSYQHVALSQPFTESGYETEIVSVDKTTDPYDFKLKAYQEGRISFYNYEPYLEEVSQLEVIASDNIRNGKRDVKIDHRPGEKKDVSDAVAAVCWQIEQNATRRIACAPEAVQHIQVDAAVEQFNRQRSLFDAFEKGDFESMMAMRVDDMYR